MTHLATVGHYAEVNPQPIEVIEAVRPGFHLGNVIKYCGRAGLKGAAAEDLAKAQVYLQRAFELVACGALRPHGYMLGFWREAHDEWLASKLNADCCGVVWYVCEWLEDGDLDNLRRAQQHLSTVIASTREVAM